MTILPSADPSADALSACMSPASYGMPNVLLRDSSWIEYAPFAFWLVDVLRPKTIVELGTYSGYSYAVFCQAVQASRLDCRCYGIDNWRGDEHTGFYGEEVFSAISDYNDSYYKSFSQLIRSEFDQAMNQFDEGSIDLLHIDGCHDYESVKSDYALWRSRLSKSGVVLFHDTNVREKGFGVARLWQELSRNCNHFEFLHGHGLGVLGVGESFPRPLEDLFRYASDSQAVNQIRLGYSRLGLAISDRMTNKELQAQLRQRDLELAQSQTKISKIEMELGRQLGRQGYLSAVASQREAEIEVLQSKVKRLQRITAPVRNIKRLLREKFGKKER